MSKVKSPRIPWWSEVTPKLGCASSGPKLASEKVHQAGHTTLWEIFGLLLDIQCTAHVANRLPDIILTMVQPSRYRSKQLRKRLHGLQNKAHEYGQLGVNVVLVLEYHGREGGYSYVTSEDFFERISEVVSAQTRVISVF